MYTVCIKWVDSFSCSVMSLQSTELWHSCGSIYRALYTKAFSDLSDPAPVFCPEPIPLQLISLIYYTTNNMFLNIWFFFPHIFISRSSDWRVQVFLIEPIAIDTMEIVAKGIGKNLILCTYIVCIRHAYIRLKSPNAAIIFINVGWLFKLP